jgi:dTDP-4-dehydrorhamnose 3,5-epimerase/CDP-3, 6-dideoxy-D-glycero-D-glycero-4-hexulose-5-epimerase
MEVTLSNHFTHEDNRGVFQKVYPNKASGEDFQIKELFWSESARGVVRGMHYQMEPKAQRKIVWVSHGEIIDVVLDLREGSTFGQVHSFILSSKNHLSVTIPVGYAHGFQVLSESAIVNYATDSSRSSESENGVLWNSFGFEWPEKISNISDRDLNLPKFLEVKPIK